jgi:hypothetical protein
LLSLFVLAVLFVMFGTGEWASGWLISSLRKWIAGPGPGSLPPDPVTEQNNRLWMGQEVQIEVTPSTCEITDCALLISWAFTDCSELAGVRLKGIHFVRLGSSHLFLTSRYHFDGEEKEGKTHRHVAQPGHFVEPRDRRQSS